MPKPIKITKVFDSTIEEVWQALTDPNALSEWLMPTDFKPELNYEFQFKSKPAIGFDGIVNCKILELKEKELLSYSWSGGPLKETRVTFRLSTENNGTRLDFEHGGFSNSLSNILVKKLLSGGWKKIITLRLLKNLTA
jgi:uncharacterized protein YndB with AHSA1/START domain